MATGELRVDSYLWREATHKTKIGPIGSRIAKGSRFEILPDETAVPNDSRVKVISAKIVGQNGEILPGTVGHITTGKIKLDGDDLLESLAVSKPAINGLGKPVISAWGDDNNYIQELESVTAACDAINELLDLFASNETSVEKWKKAAQGLSGVQVVVGVTMIGLAIGATVATAGAAAPLLLALGIAGGVAGATGAAAGVAKGTMHARMRATTHRAPVAAKDVSVSAAAPFATRAIVHGVAHGSGQAAASAVSSTFAFTGGVAPTALGAKGLYDLRKVDPAVIWTYIRWPAIVEALELDRDLLTAEKICVEPDLQTCFDFAIAKLGATLDRIPRDKIGE